MNMKRNTIKWKIFKNNILIILLLITLTTVIFNLAVNLYIRNDIVRQLKIIASHAEDTALEKGPGFFPKPEGIHPPPLPPDSKKSNSREDGHKDDNDIVRFYFMLDRSLRETLSVLNADYILLDSNKSRITPPQEEYFKTSPELINKIFEEVNKSKDINSETYTNFNISGNRYIAIIKPVSQKNSFGLGWIIVYSSLQKVNQLQWMINIILLCILIFTALIIAVLSSSLSKKISAPFSSLNIHIRGIAERNFGSKINIPVDDELQELVNNINVMSEKLETYDKAQKTFLQNVSHEFRTPLMSIQSYAEGIQYEVVDNKTAAGIIIDESKRLTHLVEDLLYLSRLDSIEENYCFDNLSLNELINSCVERMNGIAAKNNIEIIFKYQIENVKIYTDEEKLSRAILNILSNCIRYAKSSVIITLSLINKETIKLAISDDGPGFDNNELPNIFERFYKGKKGNFGLGLSISKNIIEKLNGKITAENSESGALFTIELPLNKAV